MSYTTQSPPPRSGDQPEPGSPTFGGIDKSARRPDGGAPDFRSIQASPEFIELRSRVKRFVFPMTVLFLVWYMAYVLLADYAHDFMSTKLFGDVNVGLVMGMGQFASSVIITTLYVRFADRTIDPSVDKIRQNTGGIDR